MILSAARLFDFALIAASKAAQELRPFVDYCNTNFEKLIRANSGELTLQDNIKGQYISISLQHGVATTVAVNSTSINGIVPMACDGDAIAALNWQFDQKGGVQLKVYFQSASTTKRTCKFFVFLQ